MIVIKHILFVVKFIILIMLTSFYVIIRYFLLHDETISNSSSVIVIFRAVCNNYASVTQKKDHSCYTGGAY